MKVGIIGAGAMGSAISLLLYKNKMDFILYEKSTEIIDAVEQNGLIIQDDEDRYIIHPEISNTVENLQGCSLIIIMVKSYSTGLLMEEIKSAIDNKTIFLSLQNGLGNREKIEEYVNSNNCIMGSTTIGATKTGLNSVKITGYGEITLAYEEVITEKIIQALENERINIEYSHNVEKILCEKAIINAGINPIGALLTIRNGDIVKNKFALEIQDTIIDEIFELSMMKRLEIDKTQMKEKIQLICKNTSSNKCSMLQDIENKRKTEIDFINGYFIKISLLEGKKLPYNDLLVKAIKAKSL